MFLENFIKVTVDEEMHGMREIVERVARDVRVRVGHLKESVDDGETIDEIAHEKHEAADDRELCEIRLFAFA